MQIAALVVAVVACAAIVVLGTRFLLTPRRATVDFGVAPDSLRALAATKGVRDITSGLVLLVVWAVGGREPFGWALVVAALTPAADAVIVRTNGGKLATALSIHAATAALVLAAGLVLALG
jgi:uncharacterized protein DUF4267